MTTQVQMRTVSGEGVELAVYERGVGHERTIVLIHGFPDTAQVWAPVADRLAESFHVVTYDVRGAGASSAPADAAGYRLEYLMADLAAVIDAVAGGQRVHLVGHDWGSIQGWEAVTTPALAARLASYTSICAPPLDHAAQWMRSHVHLQTKLIKEGLNQGMRSWYTALFQLPIAPRLATLAADRGLLSTKRFAQGLVRLEGLETDESWPASTLSIDFVNGINLYRANLRERIARPGVRSTDLPVQLLVALQDRYVTAALLNGLENWSPRFWRREYAAGHWIIRSHVAVVARDIEEFIRHVEGAAPTSGLEQARLGTLG